MTDGEAIELIRQFEYRRQNAAAEHLKGLWYNREISRARDLNTHLACGCLEFNAGDYVSAYEYAKDR